MKMEKFIINEGASIRQAMQKLDKGGEGFLAIGSKNKISGIITDGDVRRAILNGMDLGKEVGKIANKKFIHLATTATDKEMKDIFKNTRVRHLPVLKDGCLVDVIFEEDFLLKKPKLIRSGKKLKLPVVIMAGGRGKRLDPFSRVLPKALLPINEKPMVEIIMDRFAGYGMKNFYLCLHDKAKMIRAYFHDYGGSYDIKFSEEDKPRGTIGAIKLLEDKIKGDFFISNCDILILDDLNRIYDFHQQGEFSLTMVAAMKHTVMPYGICEINPGGSLKKITEKPKYDFLINTGLYVINSEVFNYLPAKKRCDMTDLIQKLKSRKKKIGVYPISEKSWLDVGQWDGYNHALQIL